MIEALLDDITVGLTRYRSIAVLAAHSGRMASQDGSRDFEAIGKRFGVDYILSTVVNSNDAGSTATFLLLDARTSESLMAMDKKLRADDLPGLFSRLSFEIVRQLVSTIERREVAFPTTTDNSNAYQHFLNGRRFLWHSDLPEIRKARASFRRSIKRGGQLRACIFRAVPNPEHGKTGPRHDFQRFAHRRAGVCRQVDQDRSHGRARTARTRLYQSVPAPP